MPVPIKVFLASKELQRVYQSALDQAIASGLEPHRAASHASAVFDAHCWKIAVKAKGAASNA